MPLALFGPAASNVVPAAQPAALSDDELFGGGATAVAPPLQAHTLAPAPLSDDEVFGQANAPGPSLWDRVKANAQEGFSHGTIMGGLANLFDSQIGQGVQSQLRGEGLGANADAYQRGAEAQRGGINDNYAAMPSYTQAPTIADKLKQGAAALIGQVAGPLLSPESLITDIPGVSQVVERAIAPVMEKVAPKIVAPAATRMIEAGANQAVVNTATDPVVQGTNIASGAQKTYDPVQTALAPALGFLVGGTVHGVTEGLPALADAFRAWRGSSKKAPATGAPATPDAAPSPEEIDAFAGSPQMAAYMKQNGLTDPKDPRVIQLQERIAARRAAEAQAQRTPTQAQPEVAQAQGEKDNIATQFGERGVALDGEHPAASAQAGMAPRPEIPPVIPMTPAGQGDVGDAGVRAGINNADAVKQDIQDKASEAFKLAQLQRDRAAAAPTPLDTQPGARPQGADQQSVVLDEGFPVQVLGRKMADVKGQKVEVATVHRYDPRTGQLDPEAMPYDVPVRQLKTSNYAVDPRQAQDFVQRAQGPGNPEKPRMATDQRVVREPDQTFRTTPADPNEHFPGATKPGAEDGNAPEGRSPLPDQPEGPGPFKQRPTSEEEAIRDFQARQRQGADDYAYQQRQKEGARKGDEKTSSMPGAQDADGRYPVDDRGFVASDKGGPVKFADQKQAAKWIINEGHKKSPDQIFEIENHPSGKGFTVHERGRAEPKAETKEPPPGAAGGGARAKEGGLPGALPSHAAPRAEAPAPKKTVNERMAAARKAKAEGTRGTLFDAIREKGGIRDVGGNEKQILQGYKNPPFKKRVLNPNGLHPDKMRSALQEDGWFGHHDRFGAAALETGKYPGDDITDMHDLMDREARGEKIYHPDSEPGDIEAAKAEEAMQTELEDRAGVMPGDSPEEAARKMAEFQASADHDWHMRQTQAKLDATASELSPGDKENLDVEGWQRETVDEGAAEDDGSASRTRQSNDIPGWEKDDGANDSAASSAERGAGKGDAAAAAESVKQTRAAGTEHEATADELKAHAAKKDAEERQQNPRAYSGKAQKPADDGLFADKSEENQEDMFKDGDQKDAAKNLRDKFSANPVFDPEVWRDLGHTLAKSFGWARDEADVWSRHLENMMSALPKGAEKEGSAFERAWKATYPMRRWVEVLAYSNDGRFRSMSSRFKSEPVREIANKFFPNPRGGKDGAIGKDYFHAITERRGRWLNQLEDALAPFRKMGEKDKDSAMNQIGRLVQNPGAIKAGTPIHDAAAQIGRILKEAHTYLREAGVEVGEVKRGYLPRVENLNSIMADPEKFKATATRAFVADGIPIKDAKAGAEEWFQRVMLGDLGIHHDGNDFFDRGGGQNPSFTKGRVLSKKADDIMGDFYLRNPADIMPAYISRAVQKAEWARRFGPRDADAKPPRGVDAKEWRADPDGKWKDLKQRMIDEGNGHLVPDVVRIIKSMTGNMGGKWAISGSGRAAINFARTWSALTYLPKAVFASLSEPMNIALRTGNTLDAGRAYVNTLQHWLPIVRNAAGPKYLRELAHDLGFIGEAIDNLTMLQRVGNEDGTRFSRQVQSQFFKRTGLTQLTEANRMAAVQIGMTFIRRLASDVSTGSHYETISRRMLAELGIGPEVLKGRNNPDAVNSFANWVMDLDNPKSADILKGGDMGELYHTALGRFVSQTVMAPTGATRSYFAQHPLGGLIYNLQSFNFAFQKNVLNRIGALTKDAINPKSGLNMHERAYAMMPLLNVVPLLMVTYGIGEIRDALFQDPARKGRPDMTFADKGKRALSRAGITGSMDLPYNAVTGARYQRDPLTALLGPIVGGGDTLVGDALDAQSGRNSPTTNTFERKAAKDVYQMVVQPTLEAGALTLAPEESALGFGLGTSAIYGASHPAAREHVVKTLFGPPLPPR